MTLQSPTVGEVTLLQYLVALATPTNLVLHLYTNDPTSGPNPFAPGTVIANFTEAAATGYNPITLVGSNWTTTTPASLGTAVYSEVTFTFTTAVSVYGYYVTSTNASTLLWCERFSGAPFTLPTGGGTIGISPKVTLT
jgi:hypothetical protein